MIYRLTVSQDWRDGNGPTSKPYDFSTMQDAENAQALLKDVTAPITDDLFCSSVIDEIPSFAGVPISWEDARCISADGP